MEEIDLTIHIVQNKNHKASEKCFYLFFNDYSYFLDKKGNKQSFRDLFREYYLCKRTNLLDLIVYYGSREGVKINKIDVYHACVNNDSEKDNKSPDCFSDYYKTNKEAFVTEPKLIKSTTLNEMISEYDDKHKREYVLMNRFGLFFTGLRRDKYGLVSLWSSDEREAHVNSHYKLETVMRSFRRWMPIDGKDGYTMNKSGIVKYDYISSVITNAYRFSGKDVSYWQKFSEMFNKGCKYKYLSDERADDISRGGYPMKMYTEWHTNTDER